MRKLIPSIILLVLALNIICEPSHNVILNKFMDKSSKELFQVYHLIYKKSYSLNSEIGLKRYKTFKANVKKIKETNAKNLTYKLGVTKFTDLTQEEFKQQHLVNPSILKNQMNGFLSNRNSNKVSNVKRQVRQAIDWRKNFQDARDQGECGSCWTFATAGSSEANWWNSNQNQTKIFLSTQQLVDCDKNTNNGCNGGWYNDAFEYLKKNGLVEDKNYPYTAQDGTCNVPGFTKIYKIDDYKFCDSCDMDTWYSLLQKGPIAVAVDATNFQNYQSGVFSLTGCGDINHAVIAVGWDKDKTGEYLIIRNSWSTSWGENGYMRVYFNDSDKTCGLTDYAYLPIVKGTPPPPPPPPTPTDCFKPTAAFIFKNEWKLPAAFNATLSFNGNGTDFQVAAFDKQNGTVAYNIRIGGWNNTSTKISKDKDFKSIVCQWDFSLDPLRNNKYTISYSPRTSSILLTINGVTFTCKNNANASSSNFIAFAGNAVSVVNICNTTISPNYS